MTRVSPADRPGIHHGDFVFRPLAVPSQGSAQLAVWTVEVRPSAVSELHSMDREEVFVLQAGRVVATLGDTDHELAVGDALIVPPDTPLCLRNADDHVPAQLLACTTSGMRVTVGARTFAPPWAQ